MRRRGRSSRFAGVLSAALLFAGCATRTVVESSEMQGAAVSTGFWVREELFFGRNIPNGGTVSDSALSVFVEREVLPRFPDGFSLYDVTGYYRMQNEARAVRESTSILLIVYRENDLPKARAVGEVAAAYKRTFRQESVLRVAQRVRATF